MFIATKISREADVLRLYKSRLVGAELLVRLYELPTSLARFQGSSVHRWCMNPSYSFNWGSFSLVIDYIKLRHITLV